MIDFDFDDIDDGLDDDSIHNEDNHLPGQEETDDLNHTKEPLPGEDPIPGMGDPEPDDDIMLRPYQEEDIPDDDDVPQGCPAGEGCWSSCIGGLNR